LDVIGDDCLCFVPVPTVSFEEFDEVANLHAATIILSWDAVNELTRQREFIQASPDQFMMRNTRPTLAFNG